MANAFADLLRAYLDTVYAPDGVSPFRIGEAQPFVVPAAYLTGWNPHSRPRSRADNESANDALATSLRRLGAIALHPATSAAADGSHAEAGWLVLGVPAAPLDAAARALGQNAIAFALPGAPWRLRCYAANFGRASPPPGVDTRFVDWLP